MYENLRTTLGKVGLKLAHINVRGLPGKFNEVTLLLEESDIDILAITETHLDRSARNKTVKITGCEDERHDRDKNGGGFLLYWKENLDLNVNRVINATKATVSVWIELHIYSQRYLIGSIYRPPDKYDFCDKLKIILHSIWIKRKNIILMGDLYPIQAGVFWNHIGWGGIVPPLFLLYLWSNYNQTWHDGTLGKNLSKAVKILLTSSLGGKYDLIKLFLVSFQVKIRVPLSFVQLS